MVINTYFDESSEGNDNYNGLLAVCGYSLSLDGAQHLEKEWGAMLNKYNLEFFHMCECNVCSGVFDELTDAECDLCARKAIEIARKHSLHGHAAILVQSEYREILQNQGFDCDPYTFLVWCKYLNVNKWALENRPDAKISLFFEDGYKTQPQANELLNVLKKDPRKGKNRLITHSFVGKKDSYPIQAADLIAWHIRKGYENMKNGKPIRKDTTALFDSELIFTLEYTREKLLQIKEGFIKSHGTLENASKCLFNLDDLE